MKIKKMLPLAIAFAFASIISISTAHSTPLWQYGIEDQSYSEFKTLDSGSFETESTINFGNVSVGDPALNSGSDGPGYIFNENVTQRWPSHTTASTELLTFEFTLEIDYSELDLFYGRYGSEADKILFDGVEIARVDGTTEGQWDLYEYTIAGEILAGDHTLTLAYAGGGAETGHYIDFVRLENGEPLRQTPVSEPGTYLLVGAGIAFIGARRKLFKS